MTAPKCEQCGKFIAVKSSNVFSKPFQIPDGMSILENGIYWFHKDCKLKSNDKNLVNRAKTLSSKGVSACDIYRQLRPAYPNVSNKELKRLIGKI